MLEINPWLLLAVGVAATAVTRLIGPLVARNQSKWLQDTALLTRLLPMSILLILVMKEVVPADLIAIDSGFAVRVAAVVCVVLLHIWQRKMILSILGGTAIYVLLLRAIAA